MEKLVKIQWNHPQTRFMKTTTRYVDFEGGIRSGKSTALVWKIINYCLQYPGIHCLLSRWTDDALGAQLKPLFFGICPPEVLIQKPWNSAEEYVQFENGSRCYLRALKTSSEEARYSKVAGLTLAIIGVDQPEEIPYWMYLYLKGRLSQPGFPQQILLTPNPPEFGHWLNEEFPTEGDKPEHEYIHTAVYDNARNLGDKYVQSIEQAYPIGHPMRKTLLEGLRGATLKGEAVYGKIFKPQIHVAKLVPLAGVPILEAWDFGHRHPAVVWSQFTPWGAWHIHGEIMGKSQYLEDFIPMALAKRVQIFGPDASTVWSCCDPSGASATSHGTQRTAVTILEDHDIFPVFVKNSNRPDQRNFAIQQTAQFMLRLTKEGPAFQIDPRCVTLIDGFAANYVYSELVGRGNIRKPLKDGYYDNPQNCIEYTLINFISPELVTGSGASTKDVDEDEAPMTRVSGRGRAGY